MDFFRRLLVAVCALVGAVGVALLAVSAATQFWVVASATRPIPTTSVPSTSPQSSTSSSETLVGEMNGKVNFGLFEGFKELNRWLVYRYSPLTIVCLPSEGICMWSDKATSSEREQQIKDELMRSLLNGTLENADLGRRGFFSFGFWLSTLFTLALAMLFGLVTIGFSILNLVMIPVGTVTGILGLYIWNGFAATFSLTSAVLWGVHFHLHFRHNVMNAVDVRNQWTSSNSASLGFSFWLVIGAALAFIANLLVVFVSTSEVRSQRRTLINEKPADGIMLF